MRVRIHWNRLAIGYVLALATFVVLTFYGYTATDGEYLTTLIRCVPTPLSLLVVAPILLVSAISMVEVRLKRTPPPLPDVE